MNKNMKLVILVGAVSMSACAHLKPDQHFKNNASTRASFELQCPEESLTIKVLSHPGPSPVDSQVGVIGCGKLATYVCSSNAPSGPFKSTFNMSCDWIRNGEIIRQ